MATYLLSAEHSIPPDTQMLCTQASWVVQLRFQVAAQRVPDCNGMDRRSTEELICGGAEAQHCSRVAMKAPAGHDVPRLFHLASPFPKKGRFPNRPQ